jgi:hypothetical protein
VRLWPLARCVRSWRCSSSVVQSPSEMVRSSCWAPSFARSFRLDASRVAHVSFKVCLASHLADEALQPHGEVMPGVRVLPPLGLPAKPQVRAPILKRPAWFNHDSHAEYPAVSRAGWSVGSARKVARVEGGCTHLLPVPRASKLRVDEGTFRKGSQSRPRHDGLFDLSVPLLCIAFRARELDRDGDAPEPAPQGRVAGQSVCLSESLSGWAAAALSPLEVGDGGEDALASPYPPLAPGAESPEGRKVKARITLMPVLGTQAVEVSGRRVLAAVLPRNRDSRIPHL